MSYNKEVLVNFKGNQYRVDYYSVLNWIEDIDETEEGLTLNTRKIYFSFHDFQDFIETSRKFSLNILLDPSVNLGEKIFDNKRINYVITRISEPLGEDNADYQIKLEDPRTMKLERKAFWRFPLIKKETFLELLKYSRKDLRKKPEFPISIFLSLFDKEKKSQSSIWKRLLAYENSLVRENLQNDPEYNFGIINSLGENSSELFGKFKELLNKFSNGMLEIFDLRKCVITGSSICYALTNLLKTVNEEEESFDFEKCLKEDFPSFNTIFESDPSELDCLYIKKIHIDTQSESGKVTTKSGKTFCFKITPGADLDVYFPESISDQEFKEEVEKIFNKAKERFQNLVLKENLKANGKISFTIKASDFATRLQFREIELYRTKEYQFATHHVPMVRGAFTSLFDGEEKVYFTNSLSLIAKGIPCTYNYFCSKKNSVLDILLKYYFRGYERISMDCRILKNLKKHIEANKIKKFNVIFNIFNVSPVPIENKKLVIH
jgi:hypothetical protein